MLLPAPLLTVLATLFLFCSEANALCDLSSPTDLKPPTNQPASPAQSLNENFPTAAPPVNHPWREQNVRFDTDPQKYADIIKSIAKSAIQLSASKISIDKTVLWTTPFMNYGNSGREHYNGLTKERGPDPGDLSETSAGNEQVWAVGWYNAVGAYQLGKIWSNRCNPDEAAAKLFPDDTLSIKFLFTDANPTLVKTLDGSPEVTAAIDRPGGGDNPNQRIRSKVRLLQVDFAAKDDRSTQTGWVFGTFAWIGPRKGDGLWDNLELVGLQWGNDPGKIDNFVQLYANETLRGKTFGWAKRPFMGFLGRTNGPADNLSSSCLSCHSRAQLPRPTLAVRFKLPDLTKPDRVNAHLDKFFKNVPAGQLADTGTANSLPLDYSLQLTFALEHQCAACAAGAIQGPAPQVCRHIRGMQNLTQCSPSPSSGAQLLARTPALRSLLSGPPPRQ